MPLKSSTTTTIPAEGDLLSAVTAGPVPPPTTSESKFLGVPDDYTGLRIGGSTGGRGASGLLSRIQDVTPRYTQESVYKWNIGKSPQQVWEMQQRLMKSGLIPPGQKIRQGVYDAVTSSAYKKALEFANQNAMDDEQAITTLESAPVFDTDPSAGGQPLQFDLPNRDDVKTVGNQVARTVLGRNLDDATQEAIAQAYEEKLMAMQQQQYQNAAVEGAKNYQAPDAQQFAQDYVRKANPNEAQAHDYANTYSKFRDLIDSSASDAKSGL